MKIINNIIIFLLCLSLIGFFANFAQNDYGAVLTAFCFWLIAGCFFAKSLNELRTYKGIMTFVFFTYFMNFLLSFISEELTAIAFISTIIITTLIYPIAGMVIQRKDNNKTNWLLYFRYLFFGYLFFGIYLKELHFMGAGILMGLCLFQVFNYILELIYMRKAIIKNSSSFIYFIFSLDVIALLIATTFKIQHWPGAGLMFKLSPYLFLFLLISSIFAFYKKHEILQSFNTDAKILLVVITIINFHGVLRHFQIVPKIYRNEMPTAYYEIDAKANDLTEEGRKYMILKNDFRDSYDALYEQIQESKGK